jgi:hypothetical protein
VRRLTPFAHARDNHLPGVSVKLIVGESSIVPVRRVTGGSGSAIGQLGIPSIVLHDFDQRTKN